MIYERSAGAVVFRRSESSIFYLMLHYPAGHWDFPKGNIEGGEGETDTVRREIEEETGIEAVSILPDFKKKVEYYYRRGEQLVHKVVTFYLAEVESDQVTLSYEHRGYAWMKYDEAIDRVTFKTAKNILKEANESLRSSQLAP